MVRSMSQERDSLLAWSLYDEDPEASDSSLLSTTQNKSPPKSSTMVEDDPRALEEGSQCLEKKSLATAISHTLSLESLTTPEPAPVSTQSQRSAINPNKKGLPVIQLPANPVLVGEGYFAGSIYSNNTSANIEERTHPYVNHIKCLVRQWPRLKYLADFIEAGTVPKRAVGLSQSDLAARRARVKVAAIDFSDPLDIKHSLCESDTELSAHLARPARHRLFVVEDLSSVMIERLGDTLSIDPTFFRAHLEDHTWYNIQDEWVEMPELESQTAGRKYVTLKYMQARFFEDEDQTGKAREAAGEWNVLRRLDCEGQVKSGKNAWWEDSTHQVGLLRRKISIWSTDTEDGWTGVILVDPTLHEGHPLWNGYGRLDIPPTPKETASQSSLDTGTLSQKSLFDQLVSHILGLSDEAKQKLVSDPEHIVSHAYPFVFAEILITLQYTFTGLFQIEWQLDSERTRELENLGTALDSLHKWQRRLPFYVGWVRDAVTALEGRYSLWQDMGSTLSPFTTVKPGEPLLQRGNAQAGPTLAWQRGLHRDFISLLARLQALQLRADKIMKMAVAIISVEEGKKAVVESRNMGRITYLAFIFVPMSFVASFLSMNEEISHRNLMVYGVFFAVALPLALAAAVLAAYWNSIMEWWEKRQVRAAKRVKNVQGFTRGKGLGKKLKMGKTKKG